MMKLRKIFNTIARSDPGQKSVHWAIETRCSAETRKAVSGLGFPFVDHLLKLYDPMTYQNKETWDRLANETALDSECLSVFRFYIDWWLKGSGLTKNPPTISSGTATIVDHLYERYENECHRFELSFRLVVSSLHQNINT